MAKPITDAELRILLNLSSRDAARVIAKMTPEERAEWDKIKEAQLAAGIWFIKAGD
jgi:flagellar motility protein MotE (MotC chaperone)